MREIGETSYDTRGQTFENIHSPFCLRNRLREIFSNHRKQSCVCGCVACSCVSVSLFGYCRCIIDNWNCWELWALTECSSLEEEKMAEPLWKDGELRWGKKRKLLNACRGCGLVGGLWGVVCRTPRGQHRGLMSWWTLTLWWTGNIANMTNRPGPEVEKKKNEGSPLH